MCRATKHDGEGYAEMLQSSRLRLLDSEMISGVFVVPRTHERTNARARAHTHTHTHTHTGISVLWPPALQRSISVAPNKQKTYTGVWIPCAITC